jgi:hypothetical protein
VRRSLAISGVILVAALGSVPLGWHLWLRAKLRDVAPAARPAARTVLNAQLWSNIAGGYWEDELALQSRSLTNLSVSERVSFHEAILLNCDLDASRAELYIEAVGRDAHPLLDDLIDLQTSLRSARLTGDQRATVDAWVAELRVVIEQRESTTLKAL